MEQSKCNVMDRQVMQTTTCIYVSCLLKCFNLYIYQVTTSIYNLVIGKVYCDHFGTMHIQGSGGYSCKLKFKKQSIMNRNPHQVRVPPHYIGVCVPHYRCLIYTYLI